MMKICEFANALPRFRYYHGNSKNSFGSLLLSQLYSTKLESEIHDLMDVVDGCSDRDRGGQLPESQLLFKRLRWSHITPGLQTRMRVELELRTYLNLQLNLKFELTNLTWAKYHWSIEKVKIAAFWENPEKMWSKFSKNSAKFWQICKILFF